MATSTSAELNSKLKMLCYLRREQHSIFSFEFSYTRLLSYVLRSADQETSIKAVTLFGANRHSPLLVPVIKA